MRDAAYEDYLAAVNAVSQPRERLRSSQQANEEAYRRAIDLAETAATRAREQGATGTTQIEAALARARGILEKVGEASLVPPRIKASSVPARATTQDVSSALAELAAAVDGLGPVVSAELSRRAAEEERLRRELEALRAREDAARRAAEAESLRRRKRQRTLVLATAGGVLVAAVVIALALLH